MKIGSKQLYHHLDIFYIIQKLTEIDKLKMILLNQQQLKLFEYLPKPKISISEQEKNIVKSDQLYYDERTEQQKAQEAFLAFQNINRANFKQSPIDRKLIEIIDPKIVKYFEQYSIEQRREAQSSKLVEFSIQNQGFSKFQCSQFIKEEEDYDDQIVQDIDEHKQSHYIDLKNVKFQNQLAHKLKILHQN